MNPPTSKLAESMEVARAAGNDDPTFESDAFVEVTGLSTEQPFPVDLLGLVAVAATVLIITVLAVVMMERKSGQKAQQSYERNTQNQQVDWTKYYNKK